MIVLVLVLDQPDRERESLRAALRSAEGGYLTPCDWVWLLDTEQQPTWWRRHLCDSGRLEGPIFISRLQRRWAERQHEEVTEWLTDPDRRW